MKLELKHLAPYLPYKLKGRVDKKTYNQPKKERIGELKTIDLSDNNYELAVYTELGYFLCDVNDFKPILRPLSDLTINEFNNINKDLLKNIKTDIVLDHLKKGILEYNHLPYEVIEWFFKNHFDIFGLIEQGLAIDINTLNK